MLAGRGLMAEDTIHVCECVLLPSCVWILYLVEHVFPSALKFTFRVLRSCILSSVPSVDR